VIPTIEEIMRMLAAGHCTLTEALRWLREHEEMGAQPDGGELRMFAAMALPAVYAEYFRRGQEAYSGWQSTVAREAIELASVLIKELDAAGVPQ
jgi:hypothetical protein